MGKYGDNSQIDKEIVKEFCTLDELKKINVSDISDKYNVTVKNKIDFSQIEGINILDLQYESDCLKLRDKYAKLFDIDKNSIERRAADDEGEEYIYESEDKRAGKYFALSENGFVSYIDGISYECTEDDGIDVDTYATYDLGRDDVSGKTIDFDGVNVAFDDIMHHAADFAQKHFSMQDISFGVLDVYERKVKKNGKIVPQLSLLMGLYYKGILLEPYVTEYEEHGSNKQYTHEKVTNFSAEFNYENREKFSFAALQKKCRINSVKSVDKIITPECALKIVNKTFSGFGKIEASDFRAIYACFPVLESVDGYKDKNVSYKAGQKIEGRPVYAMWINKENNGISDFGISIVPEHYIYVDMISGEITTDYKIEQ